METLAVATVECFTHGLIGVILHRLSAPYRKERLPLKVVFSSFIPNPVAAETILGIKLPPPQILLGGYVKVYDQKGDEEVVRLMAERLRALLSCDICIASSAGVGYGAVSVLFRGKMHVIRPPVWVDLRTATQREVLKRRNLAVKKTLKLIRDLIEGNNPPR